jgi:hypothetical protein
MPPLQRRYNQPVAEGVWNDPIGMHLLKDPQNIVQRGCFAECLNNSSVNDNLWDGALPRHESNNFMASYTTAFLQSPSSMATAFGISPLSFIFRKISCMSSHGSYCPYSCSGAGVEAG